MPKVITSPVKRFPGTVTLASPLNFPQASAWEEGLAAVQEAKQGATWGDVYTLPQVTIKILPGVIACVEEWHLENFPAQVGIDNFPATPRTPVAQLIAWLIGQISILYNEADEVPLA